MSLDTDYKFAEEASQFREGSKAHQKDASSESIYRMYSSASSQVIVGQITTTTTKDNKM